MLKPWTQRGDKRQRQHEAWKRDENVGHAHQHRIDFATEIPGGDAQQQAQRTHGDRHQQHDVKRDSRAIDQPAKDIATEFVSAKPVLRVRRDQRIVEILNQRIVRRDPRGKRRDNQQEQNNSAANRGQRIARHFAYKSCGAQSRTFDTLTAFAVARPQRRIQRNGHDFVLGSKN
ncbi:hypothetical protein D3C72_1267200 [compost metagenome]